MGTRLYAGNLAFTTTRDSLVAALQETAGTVKDVHIDGRTHHWTGRPTPPRSTNDRTRV